MNTTRSLHKLALILACILFSASATAQFMQAKEFAAELEHVEFGNAPSTNSLIFVKRCDQCPRLGVTFRTQTQYFDGTRPITAAAAENLAGRGATVLFDPDSRYVTRVIFWPTSN